MSRIFTLWHKVWAMIQLIYFMLIRSETCTQRDLYYKLILITTNQTETDKLIKGKSPVGLLSPQHWLETRIFNESKHNIVICSLLNENRNDLGIFASSRGFITGSLVWKVKELHCFMFTSSHIPLKPVGIQRRAISSLHNGFKIA